MANAVKSTFKYQDREYKTFWNGKDYGAEKRVYVTVTSDTGSETKVSFADGKGVNVGGAHSRDFGVAALKSIGIELER